MNRPADTALRGEIARLHATLPGVADPRDTAGLLALLRILYATGRRDLPLGRLFEGHVDALQIVTRYATPAVAGQAREAAVAGAAFGVWNADLPGDPLRLEGDRQAGWRLNGGKAFASGAGILGHALVTADVPGGRQLILVDLAAVPPGIDRDWWRTIGMRRSETHLVRWADAPLPPESLIGAAGDYVREPWFSGGALRFVAVQAGGVAALFDHVRDHLIATGRAGDPQQAARLAALFGLADLAAAAVRATATRWFDEDDASRLPRVAAARGQVADLADQAIVIAQVAVGLQGLFETHPLATAITDLMVYLRQPAPDAQRRRVGEAAAAGLLSPAL